MNARFFNKIEILDYDTLRKSSTDSTKIVAEYKWLTDANTVYPHPNAFNLKTSVEGSSYDMQYIHGRTLADIYTKECVPITVFNDVFNAIAEYMYSAKDCIVTGAEYILPEVRAMYSEKTKTRLEMADISLKNEYIINGVQCPSLEKIIDDCFVDVATEDLKNIHGDLCFSNIILEDSYREDDIGNIRKHIYFIDPRGIIGKEYTTLGDYRYDIGKLAHSVIGRYDQIKNGTMYVKRLSQLEYNLIYNDSSYKKALENMFYNTFGKKEIWFDIMVHLFLSMIPLHKDKPDQQAAMLANALRLYQIKLSIRNDNSNSDGR